MAFLLAPTPFWTVFDQLGKLAANGEIWTFRDVNRAELKTTFQDPAGMIPYSNPIVLDGTGEVGPIYWEDDEAYFIQIYAFPGRLNGGQLIRTIEGYTPPASGGGGGNVTINSDILNYMTNGQFRLTDLFNNPLAGARTRIAPESWFFNKNNASGTDTITFPVFPLGQVDVESSPVQYFNLTCSSAGTGETEKDLIFEQSDVVSFENDEFTFSFFGRSPTSSTVEFIIEQFFGTGGTPSPTIETVVGTFMLDASWQKYSVTAVVPTVSGQQIGDNGDDKIRLKIRFPLNTTFNVDLSNLQFELGNTVTPYDFRTKEQLVSEVGRFPTDRFPTGWIVPFVNDDPPPGWVFLDDTSIGSAASAATQLASDATFDLFVLLWTLWEDTFAPVSGGRSGSAEADFAANKTIQLGTFAGRVLGFAGDGGGLSPRGWQEFVGQETHQLSQGELPAVSLSGTAATRDVNGLGAVTRTILSSNNVASAPVNNVGLNISGFGNNEAHNNVQPTTFLFWMIKL